MDHVFYHSKCYDGFGAAWAHHLLIPEEAEYHPVAYGYPAPNVSGKRLYIVDFSYPPEQLDALAGKFDSVTVLDHHKTAIEKLEGYSNPKVSLTLDTKKSGALLAWEHFGGTESLTNARSLIQHISDRDLWEFKLDNSKLIHKALVSYPMDFEVWDKFEVTKLAVEGVALARMYERLVSNICEGAFIRKIDSSEIHVVNTSIAWSEVGHKLLDLYACDPFVASFTVFEDQVMWSLRSRTRSGFDVSAIAKKFGGGGHENAAGFKTPRI